MSAAAPAVSQPFDALATWLVENGGSVGSITAGECEMGPVTVRGLIATDYLQVATPILSVPISSTLRDDKVPEAYPGAPWNANLAAYLLDERNKGTNSAIYPYIATLPESTASLLLAPQSLLDEVQYEPAIAAITSYRTAARDMYEVWSKARAEKSQLQFSWQDWCWALHMVHSRSIRLAITGCKAMIPGIDLLNHGGNNANGQLVLGKSSWQVDAEQSVMFVTTRNIYAGKQVLWSYGQRGNDDFYVYHGFALPANSNEDVVLFDSVRQLVVYAVEQLPALWALKDMDPEDVIEEAEAAAAAAAQRAATMCPTAAIQGTSSNLMVNNGLLSYQLFAEKHTTLEGGCEQAVLRALRSEVEGSQMLHRRLASFRLHCPEWGAPSCPSSTPELVVSEVNTTRISPWDRAVDIRIPAALSVLLDLAADATGQLQGAGNATNIEQTASASNIDIRSNVSKKVFVNLLCMLLSRRCQQLLDAFPTTLQEDEHLLQTIAEGSNDPGYAAALQYRLQKKEILKRVMADKADSCVAQPIGGWRPDVNAL